MKHKVDVWVETEKRGLFGKKKVLERRTVEVDGKTYRRMKREQESKPLTMEEILVYDILFDEE